eukprot:COSAG06_NODE_55480_length_289_cov_0.915789_1_plen_53_part_10
MWATQYLQTKWSCFEHVEATHRGAYRAAGAARRVCLLGMLVLIDLDLACGCQG